MSVFVLLSDLHLSSIDDLKNTGVCLCIDRLWSAVHPASWYYNMFVKESLKRSWKVKPDYIVAAEAALGVGIATQRQTLSTALRKRVSDKAAEINTNYLKVIINRIIFSDIALSCISLTTFLLRPMPLYYLD